MRPPKAILVFFHCPANNGYSISLWERVFWDMACRVTGGDSRIHFAYASMRDGPPTNLPAAAKVLTFDPVDSSADSLKTIADYVARNEIDLAFGFDQPVRQPCYRPLREAGVRRLISYWGAPISDFYRGWKLFARKVEVRLARQQPDQYIFQCQAMADQAIRGRGLPAPRVTICESGVDHRRFVPPAQPSFYAHEQFGIPKERRIVYYSGHFEARKGVAVIMDAAKELVDRRGRRDVHFVAIGNKNGVERPYAQMIAGTAAQGHVTFGGYRNDTVQLLQSAYVGTIATTGWDSFPVSGMEMAASGLPMIVSNLQGLPEMVDQGVTGEIFPPGDHVALADRIQRFLDNPADREAYSKAARQRIERFFTQEHVTQRITDSVNAVWQAA